MFLPGLLATAGVSVAPVELLLSAAGAGAAENSTLLIIDVARATAKTVKICSEPPGNLRFKHKCFLKGFNV